MFTDTEASNSIHFPQLLLVNFPLIKSHTKVPHFILQPDAIISNGHKTAQTNFFLERTMIEHMRKTYDSNFLFLPRTPTQGELFNKQLSASMSFPSPRNLLSSMVAVRLMLAFCFNNI